MSTADRTITDQQVREVLDGYAEQVRSLDERRAVLRGVVELVAEYADEARGLPDDDTIPVRVGLLRYAARFAAAERKLEGVPFAACRKLEGRT